ncbi:excinuclease ABC subunit UvrB, partial [Candidatus Uhrbacteria bacterium]|nr:excinuclease ABC subunit UvrB [Candidatus Uhrbacteria bacterium]
PGAIEQMVKNTAAGKQFQTLLGVTGSGKTFVIANVINQVQKPTLVIAHNKTLAAQLCNEFREFFPKNSVEYFVSYYDYYQPEAYLPRSDTYIEKEALINDEIDRLRHAATQALLTRGDVIIVASVSCIYGLGAPELYEEMVMKLRRRQIITRGDLLHQLVELQFSRTNAEVKRGQFRLRGETLEIMPVNQELIFRLEFRGQEIQQLFVLDPTTRNVREEVPEVWLFPAKHFVTTPPERELAVKAIRAELKERLAYFEKQGKLLEAERLERRTKFDLEMMKEIGFCHGIENYSRHLSGRAAGEPPATLLDYFPEDFLMVIDESHVTVPQLGGMYEGDASRKRNLIEYGFRLPSAADNRPLRFEELEARLRQVIFVSATPGPYERQKDGIVEMIVRPTGLVDPEIVVRPVTGGEALRNGGAKALRKEAGKSQVEDLVERIRDRVKKKERVMVTTLTKKMAEDLTEYLDGQNIKVRYLHSEIDTLDRIQILADFRKGIFDVLVGVNLLREGLDIPEVSLVAILDADKEGFLRSETSLIQTMGRAARNLAGQVALYADEVTGSMERAIRETERRRALQIEYNRLHRITPKTVQKKIHDLREMLGVEAGAVDAKRVAKLDAAAEPKDLPALIKEKERLMKQAANELQFELAAVLRDEIKELKRRVSI